MVCTPTCIIDKPEQRGAIQPQTGKAEGARHRAWISLALRTAIVMYTLPVWGGGGSE